jgi:structural maintenance of chromosome 3 (chondroitin sulfate proteoglycan 6)
LSRITPEYNTQRTKEVGIQSQLSDAEAIRQRLYAKQGRNSQFKSKKERDDWLKSEVKNISDTIKTRKGIQSKTVEACHELEQEIQTTENEVSKLQDRIDGRGDSMQSMAQEVQQAKDDRDRLMDGRK